MRRVLATLVLSALALIVATAPVTAQSRTLHLDLTSAAERPTVTINATGTARLTIVPEAGLVCFFFDVTSADAEIGTIFAAHIHVAPAGDPGPVVVTLPLHGCTKPADTTQEELETILQNLSGYYVNIHSTNFGSGFLRGQLG